MEIPKDFMEEWTIGIDRYVSLWYDCYCWQQKC